MISVSPSSAGFGDELQSCYAFEMAAVPGHQFTPIVQCGHSDQHVQVTNKLADSPQLHTHPAKEPHCSSVQPYDAHAAQELREPGLERSRDGCAPDPFVDFADRDNADRQVFVREVRAVAPAPGVVLEEVDNNVGVEEDSVQSSTAIAGGSARDAAMSRRNLSASSAGHVPAALSRAPPACRLSWP